MYLNRCTHPYFAAAIEDCESALSLDCVASVLLIMVTKFGEFGGKEGCENSFTKNYSLTWLNVF